MIACTDFQEKNSENHSLSTSDSETKESSKEIDFSVYKQECKIKYNPEIQKKYEKILDGIPTYAREIIKKINNLSKNPDNQITVFRLDSRSPEIIFKIGFSSWGDNLPAGDNISDKIKNYQGDNTSVPNSIFISTAKSKKSCYDNPFAKGNEVGEKFLYEIQLEKNQYADPSRISNEIDDDEIICFKSILPEQIKTAEAVNYQRRVINGVVLNQTKSILTGRITVNPNC